MTQNFLIKKFKKLTLAVSENMKLLVNIIFRFYFYFIFSCHTFVILSFDIHKLDLIRCHWTLQCTHICVGGILHNELNFLSHIMIGSDMLDELH